MKTSLRVKLMTPMVALAMAGCLPIVAQPTPPAPQAAAPAAPVPASGQNTAAPGLQPGEGEDLTASLPAPENPAAHSTLTGAVMEALTSSPQLGLIPITVKVSGNGSVLLNGVVATEALAQEAVKVVQAVPGVTRVQSSILVNQDPFAPRAASQPAAPPPANPLADASQSPQAKIERALNANPALAQVSARAYGNEITIFGTVPNDKDKDEAEAIAQKTVPDMKITNIIWVNTHPLAPPPLIPQ